MKTIKTAVSNRKIEDLGDEVVLLHLKEVLTEYRKVLINRMILDLPTYLDYRFKVKLAKAKLDEVREALYALKNSSVDLAQYDSIVQEVLVQQNIFIKTELLYKEIDHCIEDHLGQTHAMSPENKGG